jgi:TonB family protein
MIYQRQILLSSDPVPSRRLALFSAGAHLAALIVILALWRVSGPRIVQPHETDQAIAGPAHLVFNPAGAKGVRRAATAARLTLPARHARVPSGDRGKGAALQALRQHAAQATAGMVESLKVRGFYGFSSEQYDLPAQTKGKLPTISAEELPPRFEQYVTVELTIDVDGSVADARIVGGEAPAAIQRRLLAAVREFHYTPARRDGTPIPSQLDLVVHIPS